MLEKPNLPDEKIIASLQVEYGLRIQQVTFLPLGADLNTAVYRLAAEDGAAYFLKLRKGPFDETSVALPKFLSDQGISQIIPPIPAVTGQLWGNLEPYKTILYPFVDGRDGYAVDLTSQHWIDFGAALKRIHALELPPALIRHIQREIYSPQWRQDLKAFVERFERESFNDPLAAQLAGFMQARSQVVLDLIDRASRLARSLQSGPAQFVLCHSDIHAGNILIGDDGALYIVDWDNPILAMKERDLMYAGGAQFGSRRTPQEEENLFYQGYGPARVDSAALAYYRYERIIQDLAIECEQIVSRSGGGEDRKQAFHYLTSNFLPSNAIEVAYQWDHAPR
ncbi:MAG: aminoglycoside phosphotransferase family protein [Chloroflexota bacterium]|nr:MAG: aminoglycoside phosphotransferase family protein [Chloroflexota bacterium]